MPSYVKTRFFEYLHQYVYSRDIHFTWDETKRQTNLHQHGFDFADASRVFEGPTFTFEDDRFVYGEQRFITPGLLRGQIVMLAHTERDDEIRAIAMRKGTKREQIFDFQSLTN